jgi:hypothetical protein
VISSRGKVRKESEREKENREYIFLSQLSFPVGIKSSFVCCCWK